MGKLTPFLMWFVQERKKTHGKFVCAGPGANVKEICFFCKKNFHVYLGNRKLGLFIA